MPTRTFAIGDVHGCVAQLDAILSRLALAAGDHLIFLGDLVDRGPDSAGVLRRILALTSTYVTSIKGNHEEMMLAARSSPDKRADWIMNGGDATLRSYGGARGKLTDVPEQHWQYLEHRLAEYFETDTHIFVHASAYPDMPMQDQPEYILRWERFETIAPHESGKVIVCGHTPQRSGRPANKGYAVCLDTAVTQSGMLTCLEPHSGRIWQADPNGRVVLTHLSDYADE